MRMKKMLTCAGLGVLLFCLVGCKGGNSVYQVEKNLDQYKIILMVKNNPPIQGDNQVEIKILDSKNLPVRDALVMNLEYVMPAMNGMPAMRYNAQPELKGNSFKTTLNFSISGSWAVHLTIKEGPQTMIVNFNIDVK